MTRLVAACLIAAVLTGCTDDGGSGATPTTERPTDVGQPRTSSSSPTAGEDVGADVDADLDADPPVAPREGACYRITLQEAARPTSERQPLPCTRRHTARTFHVGQLDTIVEGHSLGVDSERVQRQLAETCPAELADFLGGDRETRAISRFQTVWFSPTLDEYDAGADWFRCDVVALAGSEELMALPAEDRLRGILDRPERLATYGLCGTAQPGAKDFERVACASPHSWVAISTIPIPGGDRYPGVAAVREAGDDACSDEVSSRNESLLEYRYGWEWPTAEQWQAGQRYGFCWAPEDLA